MFSSQPDSKVPGIFFILLVGAGFGLLLESALHHRGGEWPMRLAVALAVSAAFVYATDQFQDSMTRPTLKVLSVTTRLLSGACLCAVGYWTFWRSSDGGGGRVGLLVFCGLALMMISIKLHELLKRPAPNSN